MQSYRGASYNGIVRDMSMIIQSLNKSITYSDSEDHFKNGLLRLINFDNDMFEKWINCSEKYDGNIIEKLSKGYREIKPPLLNNKNYTMSPGPNGEFGSAWFQLDSNYYVVFSDDHSIAWLAREEHDNLVRELNPPIYEESYFEGDPTVSGGYGDYADQASWRLEKSKRQVQDIINVTGLQTGYVLDIGSGYGYFRKALDDAGFRHEGLEISKHANAISNKFYGFDSYQGILSDHLNKFIGKFDVVMLGDIIEHIPDPFDFLNQIKSTLRSGGFAIIKTPNINCPEIKVFRNNYHSLKREHLIYFSPTSLANYAENVGFNVYLKKSVSHLLKGFVGDNQINQWGNLLQGSDLIFYLKK